MIVFVLSFKFRKRRILLYTRYTVTVRVLRVSLCTYASYAQTTIILLFRGTIHTGSKYDLQYGI